MRVDGKTAIVTGAAQGIGRACAQALAEHGANIVLADVQAELCRQAAREVEAAGASQTLAVDCDVADDTACEALVAAAIQRFGTIDILINNAGIIATGDILETSREDFDRVLAVNLRAGFVLGQLVARHMVDAGVAGSIINMESVNAVLNIPDQVPYVVAKGGLSQLTRVMATGLARHGIRVNGIGPGSIGTDLLKVVMTDPEARRKILSRTPMGRVGAVEEVASVALFLASDYASYITGQTIYPDGGRMPLNYTVPVEDGA